MMWLLMTLYMATPLFVANMIPVVATRYNWLPFLARPVWHKYLGANKTWRGFVVGTCAGTLVGLIQWYVYAPFLTSVGHALAFGALAGFGALLGDAVESAVKRRLGIASGEPLIFFDHVDYIIGGTVLTYLLVPWTWEHILVLLSVAAFANPAVNLAAYLLGIKKTYW